MSDAAATVGVSGLAATEAGPRLRALETRHDLLRHRFAGWSCWPLLRIHAAQALVAPEAWPKGGATGYRVRELARLAARDLWALARAPRGVTALVVTNSNYRTEQEGGRWRDVLFDDFTRGLDRVYRLERITTRTMHARNSHALFPCAASNAWFDVALLGLHRLRRPSARCRAVAEAVVRDLAGEPALARLTVAAVSQRLADFAVQKQLWRLLFHRLRPRVVLMDDGYYQHDLIAGAREAGCRVAELQHGIFLADGAEYCWPDAALAHQAHMPVPDRFFTFGDTWMNLLAKDSFWGDRARAVGSARIDRFRAATADRPRPAGATCTLLVTTQGIAREALAQMLGDLLRRAADWPGLRLVVKLHPGYDPDPEPYRRACAADPRAQVILGSGEPGTFDLLTQADFHASISSACHYDALALGVRTVVLKLPTHDMVAAVSGDRVADAGELLAALRQPREPLSASVGDSYFRRGAVANFHREFASLLTESPTS
jgi:hypothetical protein